MPALPAFLWWGGSHAEGQATAKTDAMEVRSAITFTQGGIRIDDGARVQDERGRPIGGLYAAGGDTGGVYDGGYAGGLAQACVFGLTAVESILGPRLFAQPDVPG